MFREEFTIVQPKLASAPRPIFAIITDNDAWIPDLRGIPVGREGQIVAEFSVSSVPAASSHEEDKSNVEGDLIVRPNKEYSICTDPVMPH